MSNVVTSAVSEEISQTFVYKSNLIAQWEIFFGHGKEYSRGVVYLGSRYFFMISDSVRQI